MLKQIVKTIPESNINGDNSIDISLVKPIIKKKSKKKKGQNNGWILCVCFYSRQSFNAAVRLKCKCRDCAGYGNRFGNRLKKLTDF